MINKYKIIILPFLLAFSVLFLSCHSIPCITDADVLEQGVEVDGGFLGLYGEDIPPKTSGLDFWASSGFAEGGYIIRKGLGNNWETGFMIGALGGAPDIGIDLKKQVLKIDDFFASIDINSNISFAFVSLYSNLLLTKEINFLSITSITGAGIQHKLLNGSKEGFYDAFEDSGIMVFDPADAAYMNIGLLIEFITNKNTATEMRFGVYLLYQREITRWSSEVYILGIIWYW